MLVAIKKKMKMGRKLSDLLHEKENNLFLMQRTSSECVANEIGLKMVVWTIGKKM